jgi:hypothetical protein
LRRYNRPGETLPLWYLPLLVDMPSSPLSLLLASVLDQNLPASYQLQSAWYAVVLTIISGAQYYLLTRVAIAILSRAGKDQHV